MARDEARVGPLLDRGPVVEGVEVRLPGGGGLLLDDLDGLEPLDLVGPDEAGGNEAEGGTVVAGEGFAVHLMDNQDVV